MKYEVGDKVLIKDKFWYINGAPITHRQSGYCGTVMTIEKVKRSHYKMKEDDGWFDWEDSYIECKMEEEIFVPEDECSNPFNTPIILGCDKIADKGPIPPKSITWDEFI